MSGIKETIKHPGQSPPESTFAVQQVASAMSANKYQNNCIPLPALIASQALAPYGLHYALFD